MTSSSSKDKGWTLSRTLRAIDCLSGGDSISRSTIPRVHRTGEKTALVPACHCTCRHTPKLIVRCPFSSAGRGDRDEGQPALLPSCLLFVFLKKIYYYTEFKLHIAHSIFPGSTRFTKHFLTWKRQFASLIL